ncbi:hypothetical protein ACQKOF_23620 [Lysinibacillus sp. NPDC093190]|uniref:hypothetical protein n=1 Tax=Lysinibacillus sp. NPDC093190 TaxID=3390575 RepID=UPI003D084C1C
MGISNKGTKAKTITSCDNAFVTNIVLLLLLSLRFRAKNICWPKRLIGRAQPERKSTPRYGDE